MIKIFENLSKIINQNFCDVAGMLQQLWLLVYFVSVDIFFKQHVIVYWMYS